MKDLENGFEMYTNNDEVKKRADNNNIKVIENMYLQDMYLQDMYMYIGCNHNNILFLKLYYE